MLHARGLSCSLGGKVVLDGVDVELGEGEVLGLVGPNGAGKSTLMKILAGIAAPDQGSVSVDELDALSSSPQALARRRAYLDQSAEVLWSLTVEHVVGLGRYPHGGGSLSRNETDQLAIQRAMQRSAIEHLAQRPMATLSGGERMRVHLARLLAVEATYLLADEPVAALDPYFQLEVMAMMVEEARVGRGVMLVLHDLSLTARYCDRVMVIAQGRIIAQGKPTDVLTDDILARAYQISAYLDLVSDPPVVVPKHRI